MTVPRTDGCPSWLAYPENTDQKRMREPFRPRPERASRSCPSRLRGPDRQFCGICMIAGGKGVLARKRQTLGGKAGSISRIPFRASFPVADHWYATPNNACQVVQGVFTGYLSTWGGDLRRKKEQLELTGHSSHLGFVRLQIRWPWCFSSR